MDTRIRIKQAALVAILLGLSVFVPLLISELPWPIPIRARSRSLRNLCGDVSDAKRIFVAEVERIDGVIWRSSRLRVLETIKGPQMPDPISLPLGYVAGSDDEGGVFLVLMRQPDRYVLASQRIGTREGATIISAAWVVAPDGVRLPVDSLMDTVRQMLVVQANPDKRLSKEQVRVLEEWLEPDNPARHFLGYGRRIVEYLEDREDDPEAKRLLDLCNR